MFAIANYFQQNSDASCYGTCNDACTNTFGLIQLWIFFTCQLETCVVLVSSPLTLLVALWGMTSDRFRQLMASGMSLEGDRATQRVTQRKQIRMTHSDGRAGSVDEIFDGSSEG